MLNKNNMNHLLLLIIFISNVYSITGLDIVSQMEDKSKPIDIKAELNMELINKNGKIRNSKLKSITTDGGKKQMIWFLSPPDDKGVSFLKIEHKNKNDEMRLWLPAFKKIRRISSKKSSDSFMGSDLSYEDMTNRDIENYSFTLVGEDSINTQDCWILKIQPKHNINTEYSRHVSWISKNNLVLLKEESFDKSGKLYKQKIIDYIKIKEYYIPKKILVKNIQNNHMTILYFNDIEIDIGIQDYLFQEKYLKRIPN